MTEDPLAHLDPHLRELMKRRDAYEKAKSASNAAYERKQEQEAFVHELLTSSTNKRSQTTITRDIGPPWGEVRFQRTEQMWGKVYDHDAAVKAIEQEGGDLMEALVEPSTHVKFRQKALNDLVKSRREAGQDLPAGIEPAPRKGVSVSVKKKGG